MKKDTEGGIRIYKQGGGREKRGGKLMRGAGGSSCISVNLNLVQLGARPGELGIVSLGKVCDTYQSSDIGSVS